MAVAFRSASNNGDSPSTSTPSTTVPTGAAVNDIAVIFLETWTGLAAPTHPSGFVQKGGSSTDGCTFTSGDGQARNYVYWKRLTAADTGSYSFTLNGAHYSTVQCMLFSGCVKTGDPWDSVATAVVGTFGSITNMSLTTTDPNGAQVFTVYNDSNGTHTPPTGFTETADVDCASMAYKLNGGTTGTQTITGASMSSSSSAGAWAGALRSERPYLAASSQKNSVNTTTDLVADALTIETGDIVVIKAGTWSTTTPPTASGPSATGLTFTQRAAETGGSFNGNMYIWTAVAGSNLGSTVITLPGPSSNCHHAASFEIWRGGYLATSPVVATYFANAPEAVSVSITTTASDSAVTWGVYDNQSANPSTRAYRNSAIEIGIVDGSGGGVGCFYWAYNMVASAGSTTFGLTAPNVRPNAAGIEILAAPATTGTNAAAAEATPAIAAGAPNSALLSNAEAPALSMAAQQALTNLGAADTGAAALIAGQGATSLASPGPTAATPSVAGQDAGPAVSASAECATLGVAAQDGTVSTATNTNAAAECATLGVAAGDLGGQVLASAEAASVAISSQDSPALLGAAATAATLSTASGDITALASPVSEAATFTVDGQNATASTSGVTNANAEAATFGATAGDVTPLMSVNAEAGGLTFTADNATAVTGSQTLASAVEATFGVVGADVTPQAAPVPTSADVGVASGDVGAGIGALASAGTLSVAGQDATATTTAATFAQAEAATLSATSQDPGGSASVSAGASTFGTTADNAVATYGLLAAAQAATFGVSGADLGATVVAAAEAALLAAVSEDPLAQVPLVQGSISPIVIQVASMTPIPFELAIQGRS